MEIIEGNSKNFNELINNGNVLVDFYATWCGPCKMIKSELERIRNTVQIVEINVDNDMQLCKKYGVMSVPTLIYFKDDGSYISNVGFMKSDEILDFIKK